MTSWVIVHKETQKAVLETFSKKIADSINTELYDVVPILDYLVSINGMPKDDAPETTENK